MTTINESKVYVLIEEKEDNTEWSTKVETRIIVVSEDKNKLKNYMDTHPIENNYNLFSVEYIIVEVNKV